MLMQQHNTGEKTSFSALVAGWPIVQAVSENPFRKENHGKHLNGICLAGKHKLSTTAETEAA